MKIPSHKLILSIGILFLTGFAMQVNAQPKPWTKGHVFIISMKKILPGQSEAYVSDLKNNYKLIYDEAIKEGLLISYRMFMGQSSTSNDFNFMVLYEYADANSAYGNDDKWGAIRQKVTTTDAAFQAVETLRTTQRIILGEKTMDEIFFK